MKRLQAGLGLNIGISIPRILQGQIGTGGGSASTAGQPIGLLLALTKAA